MTKKVLYTDFEGIDNVIAKMMESKEIKKAVTRSNLYKFWSQIIGEKFAAKSKPYSMIGGGTMVIACENAIVAQELMYKKAKILNDFAPYLKSLKITLKDIRFDAKKWVADTEEN